MRAHRTAFPAAFRGRLYLGLASLLLAGCSDVLEEPRPSDLSGTSDSAPSTAIVSSALSVVDGTTRLTASWTGSDDDGRLAGFEVAQDDPTTWTLTSAREGTFTFERPAAADAHVLYVRAVDDAGNRDPSPEHVAFSGDNILPVTTILRGPSQTGGVQLTGTAVLLEWEGNDPDGEVAGYQYQLDDEGWISVGADCTLVRFYGLSTSQFPGDPSGLHEFRVVSVDDDGGVEQLIESPRNFRRWESVSQIAGSLAIHSNAMGSRNGLNNARGQVFEGTRVSFDWVGDASLYGGLVVCYSYAFDQADTFSDCDLASTHYPPNAPDFVPTLGSHNLYVRALDDLGLTTNANFPFEVIAGPGGIGIGERKILYVDDFDNGTGGPGNVWPTDPTEDAFWASVLAGTNVETFDADALNDIPPTALVGSASTIIWYVDDSDSYLETTNLPFNYRNPLWAYVRAGGNLILCGSLSTDALTPDNHGGCLGQPQDTYGAACGGCLDWFPASCDGTLHPVYDFLKLEQSFYNVASDRLARLGSVSPLVPDLSLDLSKRGLGGDGMPLLIHGLEACERYVPRAPGGGSSATAIPLWHFVDVDSTDKGICGIYAPRSEVEGRGHVLLLGFPPYFFDTLEMRALFRSFLVTFGETVAIRE